MEPRKPPVTPHIRPATVDDAPALADLGALVFRHTYGAAMPMAVLAAYLARSFTTTAVRQALNAADTNYLVATATERLIGYSKCSTTSPPACVQGENVGELVNLYIHPAYQGSGVGRQLLQQTIQAATVRRLTALWLCVWQANQRAIIFYQRFGFTIVGKIEVYVDGVVFDDWVMQRTIK